MAYTEEENKLSESQEADLLRLGKERYKAGIDSDMKEREFASKDVKFAHNEDNYQWDADIKNQRENDYPPRPCLSLNKIPEKIDQVEGQFRELKPSYKIRGVDSFSDPKVAEIYSGLIRHIEYNSTARAAYNSAHNAVLHCGRGAWRIDIVPSKTDPWISEIVINRIADVFTVTFDPSSIKQDKSDGKWWFIDKDFTEAEFKTEYPDCPLESWSAQAKNKDNVWRKENMIKVAEHWYLEPTKKTFYRVERRTELGTETFSTDDKKKITEIDKIIVTKEVEVDEWKWCKMTDGKVLEGPFDWPVPLAPIVFESGKSVNIEGQDKLRGMVRHAITPMQMYNYWSTNYTEQIALIPKAPYIATSKMIGRYKDLWDKAATKNLNVLVYDPDPQMPGQKPQREPPPQISSAISNELLRMEHDVMSAMGIYAAALGDSGPEVSGIAIGRRQKQGNIGSYTFTDNFQFALTYSMKVVISLIPLVYDTEQIIRILGPDASEKAVAINATPQSQILNQPGLSNDLNSQPRPNVTEYVNDLTVGKYDIVVSIGASYDTQRQEKLDFMIQLIKEIPQFGPAVVDILVQNADISGIDELVKRAKKLVPIEIRGLDPEEEPPAPKQPDPLILMEAERLKLEEREQDRKDFDTHIKSITGMMTAEAKELGSQVQEMTAIVKGLEQAFSQQQQQIEQSQQAPQQIEGRADGGPVEKGKPYIVGERGPEIITPTQNGVVTPNNEISTQQNSFRIDGAPKGKGFLGELTRPDGTISTEISAGFDWGEGETLIPLLVPGLAQQEIDFLLNMDLGQGAVNVPMSIKQKAVKHAQDRIKLGKSPFFD